MHKTNQSIDNKTQPVWHSLSPARPSETIDPTPQESTSYKSQQQTNDRRQSESYQQRTNLNDHKQRYPSIINTASIPPLMSVRSDPTTTAKLYEAANHTGSSHYDDDAAYYDSNLQTHQRYQHSNLHNRGYTTLGSYGRYRRGGTLRHQQQYTTYNTNNTSGVSSAPQTSTGTRQKKNSTNNKKSEQRKPLVVDEVYSPLEKQKTIIEEIPITKPIETSVLSPSTEVLTKEIEKSNGSGNVISDQKISIQNDNETTVVGQTQNESTKINKKNTTSSSNAKRRTNKDQQNYHQDQRYQNQIAPRHRNNYARSMQGNLLNYLPIEIPTNLRDRLESDRLYLKVLRHMYHLSLLKLQPKF